MNPRTISSEAASQIKEWLATRRGIAIWRSIDLSDPAFSLITPAHTENGQPFPKPHWKLATEPDRIITDPADILVSTDVEVKRFHVAVRMGGNGLSLKVSDGGSRRIRREVAKAGKGAFHRFSYETQDAVIFKPAALVPLTNWRQS